MINNIINYLSYTYNLSSTSPESEYIYMEIDGKSAFIDIFGPNASKRITIYKHGNGDFEIISGKNEYKYEYYLKSKDDIYKIVLQTIFKIKEL